MDIKKLIKSLLFIFIILSFAFLIYKEFSPRSESNATDTTVTNSNKIIVSGKSSSDPDSRSSEEIATKQQNPYSAPQIALKSRNAKVIVYYFHGTFRCTTCRTIEQYSKEAIEQYFPNEMKNGKLVFKPLNVEESENRHYIQDYQMFTRSLILSLNQEGKEIKLTNLKEVWTYVRDKDKFFQYVKDEVEKFLKET